MKINVKIWHLWKPLVGQTSVRNLNDGQKDKIDQNNMQE